MADLVSTSVLQNNARRLILKLSNVSDATGEVLVPKVVASTYNCGGVVINRIVALTTGMSVDLWWDATVDVLAWHIPANTTMDLDLSVYGLRNDSGAGKNGNLLLSTNGAAVGGRYIILLDMIKTS